MSLAPDMHGRWKASISTEIVVFSVSRHWQIAGYFQPKTGPFFSASCRLFLKSRPSKAGSARQFLPLFLVPICGIGGILGVKLHVKMGNILLDLTVKIRYLNIMAGDALHFILRVLLIALIWFFVWRFVEPRTQLLRIVRAALLMLSLLAVLAVMKITSG